MKNSSPVVSPPTAPMRAVKTAHETTLRARRGTRRFRRSERVPRKGPVRATMSMEADRARPMWVSVPPLSSVTQRGK